MMRTAILTTFALLVANAATVRVGDTPLSITHVVGETDVRVIDTTRILAVTPRADRRRDGHLPRRVDVRVAVPGATATLEEGFGYVKPREDGQRDWRCSR